MIHLQQQQQQQTQSSLGDAILGTGLLGSHFTGQEVPHHDNCDGSAFPVIHVSTNDHNDSNTTGLYNVVATSPSGDRMDLALNIFQDELQGVYQRSMLQAGFTSQESNGSDQMYRTFAFMAWKKECERLQSLMSTTRDENAADNHHCPSSGFASQYGGNEMGDHRDP
jgi:hypothetical protein